MCRYADGRVCRWIARIFFEKELFISRLCIEQAMFYNKQIYKRNVRIMQLISTAHSHIYLFAH